ncbi:MAG: AraC family transcriptional regulator [Acidobacteriota bacterium]|nr:AraC family transcriptional regulator [Acidobacteriota bacterium]
MASQISIISEDKSFLSWISKAVNGSNLNLKINEGINNGNAKPALILLSCNYLCQYGKCSNKFFTAAQFPEIPLAVARPIHLKNFKEGQSDFLISFLRGENVTHIKTLSEKLATCAYSSNPSISKIETLFKIIQVQKQIVESKGKVFEVSELSRNVGLSVSWFSTKFKEMSGIPLKTYANKIRLCHSLWELISTYSPIKSIAIDFGYKPLSFSMRFHEKIGIWPSEVRRRRRSGQHRV